MRTTQAARYARWSAAAAVILSLIVAAMYARRAWQAREVEKRAPAPVPATVQQRSAEFAFSKVEKDRTIFTVRARRATAFKEGSKSLLEDVWITIYGRAGDRADNIHTQSCDYVARTGQFQCAGAVQIDLESAADAKRFGSDPQNPLAAAHIEHVQTSNVSFDRNSGLASTANPVVFRFPDGEGRAVGASYDSREAVLRLSQKVEFTTRAKKRPPQKPSADLATGEPVHVAAGGLEYRHHERVVRLTSPVHLQQGAAERIGFRELNADELAFDLDANYRVRRIEARPVGAGRQVELRSRLPRGVAVVTADALVVIVNAEGWAERAEANGSVRAKMSGDSGEDRISAARLELALVPRQNHPETLTATGEVVGVSERGARAQRLETSALRLHFAPKTSGAAIEMDHAETLAPGTLTLQTAGAAGQPPRDVTKILGQQLAADFAARGLLRIVSANHSFQLERRLPGRSAEMSSAQQGSVRFDDQGEWAQVDEDGDVRLSEGLNAVQAGHARLERATDLITLTRSAQLTDGTVRVTADSATFNTRTEDFRAERGVHTAYLKAEASGVANFSPQPAFLVADHVEGNSSGGRALYTGHARLWQGDSVIEADSIELLRDARRLTARGHVAAAFVQASRALPGSASVTAGLPPVPGNPARNVKLESSQQPELWRIRAASLTYWSGEARALLDGGVNATSSQGSLASQTLELLFAPATTPAAAPFAPGVMQLVRLLATGGVTVGQGDRQGKAEQAVYTAADQKFVLSGGNPTLYDGPRGTTTGRQLTFFTADDTILVDSEKGSRTLTRHRVEK